MLRVCRVGRNDYPARDFFGRLIEAAVDPDVFSVFSYRAPVWWGTRRSIHGPLRCAARKAPLKPSRATRATRKLDHGRQSPGARRGSVCKILRRACRRRPGGRPHGGQSTVASVHAEHKRWILPGGLGERRRDAAHCHNACVAVDLWQPQRPSGKIAHASGDEIMNACGKILTAGLLFLGWLTFARAQEQAATAPRHLTLQEAIQLALKHNHAVRMAGFQVEAKQHAKDVAKSGYFPKITNETRLFRVTDTQFIQIAAGSLGTVAGTPIPANSVILNQGGLTFVTSGTGLEQPLTQLYTRVRPQNEAASAELAATRANAQETENEVALQVHELYYRVLITQLHHSATEARIKAAEDLQG